jgi:hypothetical protein
MGKALRIPMPHRSALWRVSYLASVLVSLLLLSSCGEDEEASGELVGPSGGPRVDESVLALGVVDGVPVGITSLFLQEDIVHLWVRWEGLAPPHETDAVWFDPIGQEVDSAVVGIADGPSDQITDFSLELTLSSTVGRWEVALYLDSALQRSHTFDVVEAP